MFQKQSAKLFSCKAYLSTGESVLFAETNSLQHVSEDVQRQRKQQQCPKTHDPIHPNEK